MIDPTDRRLLTLLDLHPTATFTELAARLEVSESTVARRYRSLRSRRQVRVVGRTLPVFGGQVAWLVRSRITPARTETLATALAGHERTRWVRATRDAGELVYGLVGPADGADGVLRRLPDLPGVRTTTPYELLQVWSPAGDAVLTPPAPLDALDRRIIEVLSEDGRTTDREIARRAAVDETTVARRRRRLEEAGILYYEADIPQEALGRRIDAMLWLDVPPGRLAATGGHLQSLPECRFVAVTSGPTTMVANIAAESNVALVTLVDTQVAGFAERVEISTMGTVFKRLAGRAMPV